VFILKEVKVVCFDTLLQVLIPQGLHCTKIVQNGLLLLVFDSTGIRFQGRGGEPKKRKAAAWLPHSKIRIISYSA
jgi:hypothetical protein